MINDDIMIYVQEGKRLHLECEIEALPKPEIFWFLGENRLEEGEKGSHQNRKDE